MLKIRIAMKIVFRFIFYTISLSSILVTTVNGQDSIAKPITKPLKNIIKLNISTGIFYETPLVFEYERVLKKHQTFSIQAGYSRLPFETNTDSLRITSKIKQSGLTVAFDYRFYLAKENKYDAPHGIYLAPYFSIHHFNNQRNLELLNDSNALVPLYLDTKYNFTSIGAEIGYQFTFGKRWTLDCILFGPSLTNYFIKSELTGELTEDEISSINQAVLEKLANHFPFLGNLLNDQVSEAAGLSSSWNYGFRYSIHVGFRF